MESLRPQTALLPSTRCPFCHEAVDAELDLWLVCSGCLARHHDDCWDELGECASCRCGQALGTEEVPVLRETEQVALPPRHPNWQPSSAAARWSVVGLAAALATFSLGYRALVLGHLEQTSALFVGLPLLLTLVLIFTASKARSATGLIVKGITLALLLSGVALGEGFICILMAAPLFYLVGIPTGLLVDWLKKRERSRAVKTLSVAPFLLLSLTSLEGVTETLSFARDETVRVVRVVDRTPGQVRAALAESPRFERPVPAFLRLGFPLPQDPTGSGLHVGAQRKVHFAGSEGEGDLVLEVIEHQDWGPAGGHLAFRLVEDTSPIAHWLEWEHLQVDWRPVRGGGTEVTWTLSYRRLLDPAWYFAPMERYAVGLAGEAMIDTVEVAR